MPDAEIVFACLPGIFGCGTGLSPCFTSCRLKNRQSE
jgi:hypothetical protein